MTISASRSGCRPRLKNFPSCPSWFKVLVLNFRSPDHGDHVRSRRSFSCNLFPTLCPSWFIAFQLPDYQPGVPSTRAFDFSRDGVEITHLPNSPRSHAAYLRNDCKTRVIVVYWRSVIPATNPL